MLVGALGDCPSSHYSGRRLPSLTADALAAFLDGADPSLSQEKPACASYAGHLPRVENEVPVGY